MGTLQEDVRDLWGDADIQGPRHNYREARILALIRRHVPPGARILDAGCGGGTLMVKMAARGYRVEGIEASPRSVERVQDRLEAEGVSERASVRWGSVLALPFEEASFDALVSAEVLEHVPEDARAVAEFYRVLRPGGVCIVSVPAHPSLWDETDVMAGHFRRYTRGDLEALFQEAGFQGTRTHSWGFPLVRLYHRWVFLPFVRRRLEEERRRQEEEDRRRQAAPRRNGEEVPASFRRPPGPEIWLREEGRYPTLSRVAEWVFHVDTLFGWIPWGVGWLLVARKP